MLFKYTSFMLFLVSYSQSADILAIIPTPSYSHQIAHTHFWKELSLRGHKVTLITTDPLNDPTLTNLTEIDMKWCYKFFSDISDIAENTVSMWSIYDVFLEKLKKIADAQLSHFAFQDLIHNHKRRNFDVVFVEHIYQEYLIFAEIYKCPKILISSMEVNAYIHHLMGNPAHPVLNPDFVTPFSGSLNFKERVISTLFSIYVSYFYHYKFNSEKEKLLKKHFGTERTVAEIVSDVDMLFVNANPVLQLPRAIGPTTINIGGRRPIISPKPLSQDLQQFLDSAENGFIYFSLGSNVKSKDLNEDSLKAIIKSLVEMPYKVLWKFEADTLPGKPDNVKLVKWTPQQNVLVINDPSYKNSIRKLKQLILDMPMTGLEKAVWWTEYIIRNKGTKHLRNPSADIPFYQYYLIDVISFLIFVTILVSLAIVLLIRVFKSYLYKILNSKILQEKKLQ
ncbi:hypothetical protein NQ314_008481 [Rhamnusium bicolor]|uniref:Uncharacterized protein n=1 Tax=Rhamnusium bicolor TaxID=1586634 RepID=A0AAV8YCD4_9CUCU|nr:hypothetical protein NQ314_008481 [Rhamnusium bicolor]